MEYWDAYDNNLNKINDLVLIRGENIPDGVFHLSCDVIVKHSDGTFLLMKRDYRKHLGGLWESTAGGSAFVGETAIQCAERELFEETGITSTNLKEIGRITISDRHSVHIEYLCQTDCEKDSIVLQDGETIDYKWVSFEELKNMDDNILATKRILKFI